MLDHVFGRPSNGWKRTQVLAFTLASLLALKKYDKAPTGWLRYLNSKLEKVPPWKLLTGTLTLTYASPEPMSRMYTRSFFRATYVLVALDAACWTAMSIRPKGLRYVMEVLLLFFYLLNPDKADEKSRKYRLRCTVHMMRASWEKSMNPIFRLATKGFRPNVQIRRKLSIPRPNPPSPSSFSSNDITTESSEILENSLPPVTVWLFFNGTEEELKKSRKLILMFPGGGFVTMNPLCHEDYTCQWAVNTQVPIVSVDYGKAPEHAYPWALEECFDVYRSIVESNGQIVGLEGWWGEGQFPNEPIRIVLSGDSAGGNLVTGVTLKVIETHIPRNSPSQYTSSRQLSPIPPPSGVLLLYPCLNFDMACWMPSSQLSMMRAESSKHLSTLIEAKEQISSRSPLSVPPAPRQTQGILDTDTDSESSSTSSNSSTSPTTLSSSSSSTTSLDTSSNANLSSFSSPYSESPMYESGLPSQDSLTLPKSKSKSKSFSFIEYIKGKFSDSRRRDWEMERGMTFPTNLSMTSRMSYFTDRVIPPEMMRAMGLLYLGTSPNPPDFANDYFLSPLVAPMELLAKFPKVYMICGEKDPLVDDTIIFAGKLREAKGQSHREWERVCERMRKSDLPNHPLPPELTSHIFQCLPHDMVHVKILEGMSHGILQMLSFLPEASQVSALCSGHLKKLLDDSNSIGHAYSRSGVRDDEITEMMIQEMLSRGDLTVKLRGGSNGFQSTFPLNTSSSQDLSESPDSSGRNVHFNLGQTLDHVEEKELLKRRRNSLIEKLWERGDI